MKFADVSIFIVDRELPSDDHGYHGPHSFSVEAGEVGGAISVSKGVIPPFWPLFSASCRHSIGLAKSFSSTLLFFDRDLAVVLDRECVDFRGLPILRKGL